MRDLLSDLNKGDDRLRNEFKYVGWDVKLYPHSPTKGGGIHRGKPSPGGWEHENRQQRDPCNIEIMG